MMKWQLHDSEADPDRLGPHCDSRGEQQGVVVDALAGEIVLGQPDIAETELFGKAHLLDLLVNANGILFRRRRQREGEPAEAHRCLRKKGEKLSARHPTNRGPPW